MVRTENNKQFRISLLRIVSYTYQNTNKGDKIMYCDYCGNKLRDGAKFCNICGEPVTEISDKPITHEEPKTSPSDNKPYNLSSNGATSQRSSPTEHQYSGSQSQPAVQYQQPAYQSQPRPYYAPGTHPYHRLGGFLMFIVVVNYISGVLALIYLITTLITYISLIKMGGWIESYAHGYTGLCVFGMIGALVVLIMGATIMIRFANKIRHGESDFLRYIQSRSITIMIIGMIYLIIMILWAKSYDTYGIMGQFYGWKDLLSVFIPWLIGFIITSVYFGCSVRVRTYMGSDDYLAQSLFNKSSSPIPADGSNMYKGEHHVQEKDDKRWYCPKCDMLNSQSSPICSNCGASKPNSF